MKIALEHITHAYDIDILHDIDFQLEGYHSVAIIGVSGSGKSTLIRLMSGLEKPTTGQIRIDDLSVDSEDYKRHVGFVFQNHNLFPHLTLKRNITLILEKTRGKTPEEAEKIAREYLTLLHLETQMDKLPKNVSGGQAQRASIARALSIDPNIIFLDEPTASLDPILTYEVLEAIKNLKSLGKSFVFVTHVLSFVREFADYVIFMHDGQIHEHGLPLILDEPKTIELKTFMDKVK